MSQALSPRVLFAGECEFVAGAVTLDAIPEFTTPEIAFIGRSNVGKSSLINALTNRKSLARVSETPGCTRQLNFFLLNERLMLVDLPGYGYAKRAKKEVNAWTRVIKNYLRGRPNLHRVCVLIDARRGVGEADEEMLKLLDDCAVSTQLVLTKMDKLKPHEQEEMLEATSNAGKKHVSVHPVIQSTSAWEKSGIEALQEALAAFAR